MAAIDNLNANITKLNATIEAVIAAHANPGVPEAAVQAAADAVAASEAHLATIMPPPAP